MKRKYQTSSIAALLLLTSLAPGASGQRTRTVSDPAEAKKPAATAGTTNVNAPVPQNVKAKYEGGIFGHNKKQTGTLHFDDDGRRLVFRDKTQKEYISLPYKAIAAAFADTRSLRPTAATIIGSASLYTLPALLFKKKYRYLTMQFNDPDSQVQGVTSFKVENKEMMASLLEAVARKAELTPRGEAYVRLKKPKDQDKDQDK
ncbi:MAG: hypothetical protein QOE47_1567 [Pyrinomonadaceae bacterium]|jgi:hypothetical protein|nr:hypothetical protein [Pyrinomonadaceae bacterium]